MKAAFRGPSARDMAYLCVSTRLGAISPEPIKTTVPCVLCGMRHPLLKNNLRAHLRRCDCLMFYPKPALGLMMRLIIKLFFFQRRKHTILFPDGRFLCPCRLERQKPFQFHHLVTQDGSFFKFKLLSCFLHLLFQLFDH